MRNRNFISGIILMAGVTLFGATSAMAQATQNGNGNVLGGAIPCTFCDAAGNCLVQFDPAILLSGNEEFTGPSSVSVVIRADDGSEKQFSLTGAELEALARLSGMQQSQALAKSISARATKGEGVMAMDRAYQALMAKFGDSWCGPCRMVDGQVTAVVPFREGITAFITASF